MARPIFGGVPAPRGAISPYPPQRQPLGALSQANPPIPRPFLPTPSPGSPVPYPNLPTPTTPMLPLAGGAGPASPYPVGGATGIAANPLVRLLAARLRSLGGGGALGGGIGSMGGP